ASCAQLTGPRRRPTIAAPQSIRGCSVKIGVLLGDDIGHEVVPECVKVMKAAAAHAGLAVDWRPLPIGRHGHEQHRDTLPAPAQAALRELAGWIMGPVGRAGSPPNGPAWGIP